MIYHKKENGGLGSAINAGLKLMTGDFFSWCDSDNFYASNYIEENMKMFISNVECNIVRCDGFFLYEDDLTRPYRKFSDGNNDKFQQDLFLNAITETDFHFGCIMLRSTAFDAVNSKREIYESREGQNWQLILPMFYYFKSYYIDLPLFYFVNRRGSISNQSAEGDINRKLEQQNEHEKILITTIKSMKIKNTKYYIYIILKKYIMRRIELASIYCDAELLKQQEKKLKKVCNLFNRIRELKLKFWGKRIVI